MSAVLMFSSDKLWVTRRCPCDPSTQNDAGRTPASSLLGSYHAALHSLDRAVCPALPPLARSPGTAAHPRVPGAALHCAQTDSRVGDQPSLRPALPLHPDAQEALEHCRHSLSQEALSPAHYPQPGRSNTAHRGCADSLLSHHFDDPLRHPRAPPLLCHPLARGWRRPAHHSDPVRPSRSERNRSLSPPLATALACHAQSARRAGAQERQVVRRGV